jgi:Family of unknown function (DUF5397)
MPNRGFHEAQSQYTPPSLVALIGQVRRFGPFGPAYEVVAQTSAHMVAITVIESGEQLAYSIADLLADPVAETVP